LLSFLSQGMLHLLARAMLIALAPRLGSWQRRQLINDA
jgi:hypothetical protein